MKIIKTTFDDVTDLVFGILSNQEEACVYCVADQNCAIVGSHGGSNIQDIKGLGIKLVQIKHEGGTIIASEGDVQIGIFTEGYVGDIYRNHILNSIIEMLKSNGHDAKLTGNDILVNGKKVVGYGSRMFGKILYTAIQVSVGIDTNLIKLICTKPMVKEPDGLSNYGITTQDVLDILFNAIPE